MQMNRRTLSQASMLAMAMAAAAGPAFSQTGQIALTAAAPVAAPDPASDGLADIIVTAEKRSTSAQRTPAAITIVSGDALASRGITNIQQAQVLAPALHLGQEGTSTQAFIRGVGITHDSINIEPQVAINYNGVYMPREATGGSNLFDVQSIEVLPGPQGTLYGRSATGGVLNVNFKRPSTEFGGDFLAETGNYSFVHLVGAIDAPLSPAALFRVAAMYNRRDGYTTTGSGKDDDFGVRVSTILTPADRLSIFLWGSYVSHRGSVPNAVNSPVLDPAHPYNDLQPPCCQPFGQTQSKPMHEDVYSVGGDLNYQLGDVKISYIPGYINVSNRATEGLGGVPLSYSYKVEQQSNELRVNTTIHRLELLGGLYQFNQEYRDYLWQLPFGNVYDIPLSKEYGVAGYAQGIYSVTDTIRVTGGGRYSSTKRSAFGREFLGAGAPNPPYSFAATYDHFDFKLGVEMDIAPRSLAYASVQTGYNPGTYNTSPSLPLLPRGFLPTKLTSYTVGIKNRFLDNRLQLNAEGYYYDYKDLLVAAFNVLTGNEVVQNAKKVQIYGLQLDARYALGPNTSVYASGNYLHAENKDFVIPQFMAPAINLNGQTPPYSPRLTLNLGATQTIPLGAHGKLIAQVDSHHESSTFTQFDHAPGTFVAAYWETDLSLTYVFPGDHLSFAGWARNVEDTVHIATAGSGGIPGPGAAILDRPRTFGARLAYSF